MQLKLILGTSDDEDKGRQFSSIMAKFHPLLSKGAK
jgi:hypothetical protein